MKVLFLPDYRAANAYQRLLAAALVEHGVTVVADPTGRRRLAPILGAIRREGRPDVVHLHWTEPYISGGGADVSRLRVTRTLTELRLVRAAGTPIVWTAHDLSRHDRPMDQLELRFNRALFRLCGAVIVHCEAAREGLSASLDLGPEAAAKIRVIPHGHYLGAYEDHVTRDEARQRLGLPPAAKVVLFVGWVRPYKGVRDLLTAFAALPDPDVRLVVAGKPGSEEFAREVEGLAAADPRVTTRLGFVPDDEMQVYLRAADLVALPYREIFTSGSVLLAMSFGRAVLAPRRGCIAETLDTDGAILYDATDPAGLERGLASAMSADLGSMGGHNLERVQRFDWGGIAEATLATYRALEWKTSSQT